MKHTVTLSLLLFFCVSVGAFGKAADENCQAGFWQLARAATHNYIRELRQEGPKRFFVKKVKPDDPGGFRFFTPYDKDEAGWWVWEPVYHLRNLVPRYVTRRLYGKPHDFTPLRGLIHTTFNRPTRFISQRFTGVKREPTLPFTGFAFLAGIATTGLAIDAYYVDKLEDHAKAHIESNPEKWNDLIENDYAYHDIWELRQSGKITAAEAREMAYNRYHHLKNYYAYVAEHGEEVAQSGQQFFGNPLYAEPSKLMLNGIMLGPGYRTLPGYDQYPPSDVVEELFHLQTALLTSYQVIHLYVNEPEKFSALAAERDAPDLVVGLSEDPFVKEMKTHYTEGKLTARQLQFRLQEDAYWRMKFAQWSLLRVEKLKKVDGRYTNTPLTLEDIQNESRSDLEKR